MSEIKNVTREEFLDLFLGLLPSVRWDKIKNGKELFTMAVSMVDKQLSDVEVEVVGEKTKTNIHVDYVINGNVASGVRDGEMKTIKLQSPKPETDKPIEHIVVIPDRYMKPHRSIAHYAQQEDRK